MASVELKNINKKYSNNGYVVKDMNLKVKDKEFIILVGPSGCGKTSTLRMIAGLEKSTDGKIFIDGKLVNEIEPRDRDIAMVFQDYALFPHMTVYNNMAFALKLKKVLEKEIDSNITDISKVLGIDKLLKRKPRELSGGEKQRVAIGRALVCKPKVFLMDEPLSNLDAKLRIEMRELLLKIHKEFNITTIYVTHDQVEAMTLGDKIVVMKDGSILQIDTPENVYRYPNNKFTASFIGIPQMNFIYAKVKERKGEIFLKLSNCLFKYNHKKLKEYLEEEVIIGIRVEDVLICKDRYNSNILEGQVDYIEMLGSEKILYIILDNINFKIKVSSYCKYNKGDIIRFTIDLNKIHVFDRDSGGVI
jgi:multiple sugar transport system ATP-binding protein